MATFLTAPVSHAKFSKKPSENLFQNEITKWALKDLNDSNTLTMSDLGNFDDESWIRFNIEQKDKQNGKSKATKSKKSGDKKVAYDRKFMNEIIRLSSQRYRNLLAIDLEKRIFIHRQESRGFIQNDSRTFRAKTSSSQTRISIKPQLNVPKTAPVMIGRPSNELNNQVSSTNKLVLMNSNAKQNKQQVNFYNPINDNRYKSLLISMNNVYLSFKNKQETPDDRVMNLIRANNALKNAKEDQARVPSSINYTKKYSHKLSYEQKIKNFEKAVLNI